MGLVLALAILTVFDSQVRKERQYEGFVGVDKFIWGAWSAMGFALVCEIGSRNCFGRLSLVAAMVLLLLLRR